MITKRLRFVLIVIPVCLICVLIIGAQRTHPADTGGVIDPTCTSSLPCIEYDNNGTGPGIRGVSLTGNGSNGITKVNSTSATNGREGVFGNDMSTSGSFNSGVRGLSTRGTGVLGNSTSGIGVQAISSNFIGALVVGGLVSGNNYPALSIVQDPLAGGVPGADLIDACKPSSFTSLCYNGIAYFTVDGNGSISTNGGIFTSGSAFFNGGVTVGAATPPASGSIDITGQYLKNNICVSGCALPKTTSPGRSVASYSAQESMPTIEDFGEARLVNGQAYISLGADFSNVIDSRADYMVFITPEGPNRGLYVTHKTIAGFTVRENPDGHSTIAFSYRIVAKPYGSTAARLPMVTTPRSQLHEPRGLRPNQLHV